MASEGNILYQSPLRASSPQTNPLKREPQFSPTDAPSNPQPAPSESTSIPSSSGGDLAPIDYTLEQPPSPGPRHTPKQTASDTFGFSDGLPNVNGFQSVNAGNPYIHEALSGSENPSGVKIAEKFRKDDDTISERIAYVEPSSKLSKEQQNTPYHRTIEWRNGFARQIRTSHARNAIIFHSRGDLASQPCDDCSLDRGPFEGCVHFVGDDGQLAAKGTCTNCMWSGKYTACSLRSDSIPKNDKPPPRPPTDTEEEVISLEEFLNPYSSASQLAAKNRRNRTKNSAATDPLSPSASKVRKSSRTAGAAKANNKRAGSPIEPTKHVVSPIQPPKPVATPVQRSPNPGTPVQNSGIFANHEYFHIPGNLSSGDPVEIRKAIKELNAINSRLTNRVKLLEQLNEGWLPSPNEKA